MAEKKGKEFQVWAKLELLISVPVFADNLPEAIAKTKELSETNFVKVLGEYMDGSFEITGVMS